MTTRHRGLPAQTNHTRLHVLVFVVAMFSIALQSSLARAESVLPTDYRVSAAGSGFGDTWQIAVGYRLRPPRRLRAQYLELATGAIYSKRDTRAFVSLGPVWSRPLPGSSWSLKFGIAPTLLGGSTFDGRDLGGNLHFTSFIAINTGLARQSDFSFEVRAQHISNAGLKSTNPGMDSIALNLHYAFGR